MEFLRPDANVTQSGFTGGFAEIDETPANDGDKAYGNNNTAAVLEVGLSNPSGTPGSGARTVRYRYAKVNNGNIDGAGNAVTITAEVVQGSTVVASDAAQTCTGTVQQREWTPNLSGVTDWTDLRLRFTTSASGGSPSARRGGAVTWAELEVPDPAQGIVHQGAFAASGEGSQAAVAKRVAAGAAAFSAGGEQLAAGVRKVPGAAAMGAAGDQTAGASRKAAGSAALDAGSAMEAAGTVPGQGNAYDKCPRMRRPVSARMGTM